MQHQIPSSFIQLVLNTWNESCRLKEPAAFVRLQFYEKIRPYLAYHYTTVSLKVLPSVVKHKPSIMLFCRHNEMFFIFISNVWRYMAILDLLERVLSLCTTPLWWTTIFMVMCSFRLKELRDLWVPLTLDSLYLTTNRYTYLTFEFSLK